MKLKTKNQSLEINPLSGGLRQLALSRLSRKQVIALEVIKENGFDANATRLINFLSEQLSCSNSTVWNVLRALSRLKLIECGTKDNKGKKLELTVLGRFLTGGEDGKKV